MLRNIVNVTLTTILFFSCILHAGEDAPTQEKARTADAFVDTIGVNIHLGYHDTVYNKYDEILKPRLVELGIRHVRDGLSANRKDVLKKLTDLADSGIHSDLLLAAGEAVAICKEIPNSVESVEGENEPDGRKHAGPKDWIPLARAQNAALYKAIKADPATAHLPVLVSGMANTRNSPGDLGDMQAQIDFGNMHSYPGGLNPLSGGWGIALTKAIEEERKVCGEKPIVATETGYHNFLNAKGHPGVPEEIEAVYLPRLLLHYFNMGFQRVYTYEFLDLKPDPAMTDMEKHFGLVRNDGSPKPAFAALKNLIAALKDPGPQFEPGGLSFAIENAPKTLEKTLLQKRDGRFYLIVWLEERSYDTQKKEPIKVAPREIEIAVATHLAKASVLDLKNGNAAKAFENPQKFTVSVGDEIVVLELMP